MLKNGNITEKIKPNDNKRDIIKDWDKENRQENIPKINLRDIKSILNKKKEEKFFILNSNINKINLLKNSKPRNYISNNNEKYINCYKEMIVENKNNFKKLQEKHILNDNKQNNVDIKKINNYRGKIIKNNLSESNVFKNKKINSQVFNNDLQNHFSNIFSPITTKNYCNWAKSHKAYNSLEFNKKIIISPFKFLNENNQEKNLIINKKSPIFSFSSNLIIKNNSSKNKNKKISLEKDQNIKIDEKKRFINKKEKNNNIFLKYSKENNNKEIISKNGNFKAQRNRESNEEILKSYKKDNLKEGEQEDDRNIEVGNIKDIEEKDIPFNKTIFNKIIEEVKGEKNYIQKVVHRQILNQRNSLSHSSKKYDTNTFKEITIKRIKNPMNISLSKLNKNNLSTKNKSNRNIGKDLQNNYNKVNYTSNSIFNDDIKNNLNNELSQIKKESSKRSSIKIKKIPLNKLKNKIKIKNISYNNLPKKSNTPRIYPSENNYISNYSLNKEINAYTVRNSKNIKKCKKIIINEIPKKYKYNSINNIRKKDLTINNDLFQHINEKEQNLIYNKVKIQKKISNTIINNSINFNKINGLFKNINYNTNNDNSIINNTIHRNNKSQKIIRINMGKKCFERNNNIQKILSSKHLNTVENINDINDINETQNKILHEKKMGLFKKKLAGLSLDKQNKFLYFNNLYNQKINNSKFGSFISNKKDNSNNSHKLKSFLKLNNNITDSISIMSYESSKIENLNKFCANQNLENEFSKIFNNNINNNSINGNYLNNEIKLEQIITLLSFEDLIIIEDKINIVLKILKNGKKSSEELFDLLNYFFSSSLKQKFDQIFKYFLKEAEAMKTFINYSLILIIICYDFSFCLNKKKININFSLFETLRLVYINVLIAISSLKNKIKSDNKDHYNLRLIEMSNINSIIGQNLINFNNNSYNEDDISFNRELLNNNTNLLIKNISLIIKNYKQKSIDDLFYTIATKSLEDINKYFRQNIIREDFIGCSVLASTYLKEKQNFMPINLPYIRRKNFKKYSLVLDLDETLIHFKVNHEQNDEGVLKLRPGVFTFLEKLREYYEIILFTEASEAYTELIMEAFNKKKYFDYKFFRQHTIIIGQDFVKDLQRIGRPLDKIIIIDNLAQNFRMQKANGINIKPFFGEDQKDQALIYLIPILINIAKDNIDTRNGLIKYRDEIITKVTSNLFFRNSDK